MARRFRPAVEMAWNPLMAAGSSTGNRTIRKTAMGVKWDMVHAFLREAESIWEFSEYARSAAFAASSALRSS
jgi:hypothetical protein